MNWIVEEQTRRNRMARDCWQHYESHRKKVAELLCGDGGGPLGRVCVLGAGNCNDLDLQAMAQRCAEIRLVDLDAAALAYGLAAQQPEHAGRFVLDGGRDLSGIATHLIGWSPAKPPLDDQIDRCIRAAVEPQPLPDVPLQDMVASLCLLSQLVDAAVLALGTDHPRLLDLIAAIRMGHLRLILDLLRPGGRGILVTDFVSSETYPPLATVTAPQLPGLAMQLIQQRNFFTGLNPFVLLHCLNTDPSLCNRLQHARLTTPWLWRFPVRTYAVCAIELIRA